ncbi:MAG: hypothetical protein OH338_00370 [Candidatus Parvarchaeota archaeon]|jgi:hypothetical protein|nr:hypothetical protein [Candidatus Parvarchaeota archaeon]MCW1294821.1 hypothetical protein [Candidatus Parvarchaeum tengchongense]MCW1295677.1 hypothetical protein [Candidatus Parvarchaeum tengchongense]MCW1299045.1 hypothetical protein [Candidatus Parvarchaeum tengchongense]MCW1311871.1 hypothetical protein [Candidatus Parvarchaeum tengchongense]
MEDIPRAESRLEIFLSQSQFKKQVDSLGYNVFSFLSDMYEEGKFNENIRKMFPNEKKQEFDEIAEELSEKNGAYRGIMYRYLVDSGDYRPKAVFGNEYERIMGLKNKILEKFGKSGYGSLYSNFINAQFNDSLMEAEGDEFFYLGKRRFTPKDKDEELIWIFGKVVELIYRINND